MYSKRKHFGQHMLVDDNVLEYEKEMLRPEGKIVLEIGGGTGNLSRLVAGDAKHLVIVEKDRSMAETLGALMGGEKNVTILEKDFLDLSEKEILSSSKQKRIDLIASNVPYSISSPLLFKLKEFNFEKAVLCLQKEFVDRMVGEPGNKDWSRLSVMTQLYFKPVYLKRVGRGSFAPVPEVDSAIIMLFKKDEKTDERRDKFIEHLFSHKKNTLHAASKAKEMKESYPEFEEQVRRMKMETRRVFTLTIDEIKEIYSKMKK